MIETFKFRFLGIDDFWIFDLGVLYFLSLF